MMMEESSQEAGLLPGFVGNNGLVNMLRDTYTSFSRRREALGLSNPGAVDKIRREVDTDVFLTKFSFTGLKAEISKPLSISPMFQYSHSFSIGSQMPPYGFSALLGTSGVLMQGNIDNDGALGAVFNWKWTKSLVTKSQVSIAPGQNTMLQIDGDYTGQDFTASLKSINLNVLEGGISGMFVGSYLQSVTPGLALGVEAVWQRMGMGQGPETVLSYCARYKGQDWIGTAQLTGQGALSATYWRRLTERVEAGVDLNLQFAPGLGGAGLIGGAPRREGTAIVGAKYDFRASTFRAQLDSTGKVGCLLEKRVLPPVQIAFSGEIDHVKSTSKVGLALSIEIAPEDVISQQQEASSSPTPAVPF